MAKKSKQENIQSILDACIQLEVTKGHLRWNYSDVSRMSKVTRSLIYYYFKDSKKLLLKRAVQQVADQFLDIRFENIQQMRSGKIINLVRETRQSLNANPYVLQFYIKHRLDKNEFNQIFQRAEDDFYKNMVQSLPKRWQQLARVLWSLLFGLTIQPGVTEEDLVAAEKFLQRAWNSRKT